MASQGPWSTADATENIRALAKQGLKITLSGHAKAQMLDRDLFMGDILYILKNGFVYAAAVKATQPNLWKYAVETRTPNSGNRVVRVVVIPDIESVWAKIITVMWVDE